MNNNTLCIINITNSKQSVMKPCTYLIGHILYHFSKPSDSYEAMQQTSQRQCAATKEIVSHIYMDSCFS